MSLHWRRLSAFQSVALEDLLKTVTRLYGNTPEFSQLATAMADLTDLTALQCNRAVAASYFSCLESRKAALAREKLPKATKEALLVSGSFSNELFTSPFTEVAGDDENKDGGEPKVGKKKLAKKQPRKPEESRCLGTPPDDGDRTGRRRRDSKPSSSPVRSIDYR
jgi:hypothetical protein